MLIVLKENYKKKQDELIKETVKNQDVIITTALIPGKKAPILIDEEMVLSMKPGSVICDLATSQGGNVAFSEKDKVIEKRGPKIDAPKQAIDGFCKSNDISFEQLVQKPTDKGEFYFAEIEEKGKRIEAIIPRIIH